MEEGENGCLKMLSLLRPVLCSGGATASPLPLQEPPKPEEVTSPPTCALSLWRSAASLQVPWGLGVGVGFVCFRVWEVGFPHCPGYLISGSLSELWPA